VQNFNLKIISNIKLPKDVTAISLYIFLSESELRNTEIYVD